MFRLHDIDKDSDLTQMIALSGKSRKINDALLAVPQLQRLCYGKRNDFVDVFMNESFSFLPQVDMQLEEFTEKYSDLIGTSSFIEDFESRTVCCSSDTSDDEEVIPSSFPESEVCFDLDYSLDSPEPVKFNCPPCDEICQPEHFTHKKLEEGLTLPFDEPIFYDESKEAASKILSSNVLLNRFHMNLVEDPLYQSDGKPWMEECIFKEDFYAEIFLPVVPKTFISETFESLRTEKLTEKLLLPVVSKYESSSYLENFHDLQTATTLLNCIKDDSFDKIVSQEPLLDKDCNVFMPSKLPDFQQDVDYKVSFVDLSNKDSEFQRSSPFVGYKCFEISATSDDTIDVFCEDLKENLDLNLEEIKNMPLLTCQKAALWTQEMMKNKLQYDDRRLFEPVLSKDLLSDPISDVFQHLDLVVGKDKFINMENDISLKDLSKDFHEDLIKPVSYVADFKGSMHRLKFYPPEEYGKLSTKESDDTVKFSDSRNTDPQIFELKNSAENTYSELQSYINVKHLRSNPLNGFMLCRTNSYKTEQSEQKNKQKSATASPREENGLRCIGTTENLSFQKKMCSAKIEKIPFTGPYMEVLTYILEFVKPHFCKLKKIGSVSQCDGFMETDVEKMRFLYKEIEQRYIKVKPADTDDLDQNVLQSCAILLHARITLDLLLHACLESAITHLSSCIDSDNKNVERSLVHLHEELFKIQIRFLQSNCDHPKFIALYNEIDKNNADEILILVQNGLSSLQYALKRTLCNVSSRPVQMANEIKSLEDLSDRLGIAILQEESDMCVKSLEHFSLVVQYEASNPKIKNLCRTTGISYVGLVTETSQTISRIPSENLSKLYMSKPVTVFSSTELTQHKHLVYILEARYNILIVERNYLAMEQDRQIYHADMILDINHCIVFLALHEMGSQWDLEAFVTRLVAVGFQCSLCFVIAHGIGAPSRYLMEKDVILNLYKLRASLSNLMKSSTSFGALYKIFICPNEEEVAINIRAIVDKVLSQQKEDCSSLMMTSDVSKYESFLLQFICFNSYSAQKFLSLWALADILKLDSHEIKRKIPDISDNFIMLFEHFAQKMKDMASILVTSDSSCYIPVTNDKTSPVVSTDKESVSSVSSETSIMNDDDFFFLISSGNSANSTSENAQKPMLSKEILQGNNNNFQTKQQTEHFYEQKYINRHEESVTDGLKMSSLCTQKSPLPLPTKNFEQISQSEAETRNNKKRLALITIPDSHTKLPRKVNKQAHLLENCKIPFYAEKNESLLTRRKMEIGHGLENKGMFDKTMYDYERTNLPDFVTDSLTHSKKAVFNRQVEKSLNEEPLKESTFEESLQGMFFIGTSQTEHVKHSKLFCEESFHSENSENVCTTAETQNVSYFGDKDIQMNNRIPVMTFKPEIKSKISTHRLSAAARTQVASHFTNHEIKINNERTTNKPDIASSISSSRTKIPKTYGIFSEKIYRSEKPRNNVMNDAHGDFKVQCNDGSNKNRMFSNTSIPYCHNLINSIGKQAHDTYSQQQTSRLDFFPSSTFRDPSKETTRSRNFKSDTFQLKSYVTSQDKLSISKYGTDLICESKSHTTLNPLLMRESLNESKSNDPIDGFPFVTGNLFKKGQKTDKSKTTYNSNFSIDDSFIRDEEFQQEQSARNHFNKLSFVTSSLDERIKEMDETVTKDNQHFFLSRQIHK